jgi:hypothetical protein
VLAAVVAAGSLVALRAQTAAPAARPAQAAGHITSPKEAWGHNVGDDYFLANYQQLIGHWHQLEKESNRIHVVEIGKTAENRPQLMAIITSPENYANLAKYRDISRRLSLAEGLTDAQAHDLAKQGKAVVWIDGGLHATEVLGAQQLLEMVYQMVSRTDDETMRFLNDVIVLCTPANPDGMDLVSDAYMKNGAANPPVLYNHYAGHDDNRDSFMNALPETTNVSKVMYREWFPQIMYNHHQTGPAGAVMFAPPFRDPFNYNFHPEVPAAMDIIGAVIATRSIIEGMPGVVNRAGSSYSTWWNGGFRTTAYFHNQLGILTETIGNPTPQNLGFNTRFAIGDMNNWFPINPSNSQVGADGLWHFRRSIDYSIMANRAILDYASRYRETLLYRIYAMGHDEIKWGSEDHWTFTPHKLARVELATCGSVSVPTNASVQPPTTGAPAGGRGGAGGRGAGGGGGGGGRGGGGACPGLYAAATTKELRDPRGFIIPSDQPDFGEAVRFANALFKSGITILRATAPFTVAGKPYPAGSLVVKTAQAFRPHVMDMFEPQDHPDDIPYPGAPPTRPYDDAGWTLAFQMGVQFDRVLDAFDGPFQPLTDLAKPVAGSIKGGGVSAPEAATFTSDSFPGATESELGSARALYAKLTSRMSTSTPAQGVAGYYFSHGATNSFIAINRLLAAGEDVSWLANGPMGAGTFYVAAKPTTLPIIQKAAAELGLTFQSTASAPTGPASKLRKLRIGLVDSYGGAMPVGWTRLIFKDYEFPFVEDSYNDVFPPDLNAGKLNEKYDVLVFNGQSLGGGGGRGGRGGGGANAAGGDIPPAGGDTPPPAGAAGAGAGAAGAAGGAGAAGATGAGAPPAGGGRGGGRGGNAGPPAANDDRPRPFQPVAEKYTKRQGQITAEGQAAIKEFVEKGGSVIVIGNAANSAISMFNLPLTNQLVRADGGNLPSTDYFVPGSILRVSVDPKNPLAHGYGNETDIFYANDPVWKVTGTGSDLHIVSWFNSPEPLRSGWAWGQKVLDKGVEMAEARVGQGRVFVFGNQLLFRSQPHGSFKFFFNALYLSVASDMK